MRAGRRARVDGQRGSARAFAVARDLDQPAPVLQIIRHGAASEQQNAVIVEIIEGARRAEAFDVFRRGIGMKAHGEQLTLDQVGLGRLAQADRDIGLAHRKVELLVGGDQGEINVGIKLNELAEPRSEPVHADARRGRYPQIAVRPFATVGELSARGFELHEHIVGGVVKELALLGENEAARMTMKQRDAEFLLERRYLARHRRLR